MSYNVYFEVGIEVDLRHLRHIGLVQISLEDYFATQNSSRILRLQSNRSFLQ